MKLPNSLESVVKLLQKLPGIGTKSAQRIVVHLLKDGPHAMNHLGELLKLASESIKLCEVCGSFSDQDICKICTDTTRDSNILIVVAEASNIYSFERSGKFNGKYHVLGGLISPLKGIGPDQLRIKNLIKRLDKNYINEIVIATNPTLDGETTATWLANIIEPFGIKITRIGLGLPIGSDIEYADELTLSRSLANRQLIKYN